MRCISITDTCRNRKKAANLSSGALADRGDQANITAGTLSGREESGEPGVEDEALYAIRLKARTKKQGNVSVHFTVESLLDGAQSSDGNELQAEALRVANPRATIDALLKIRAFWLVSGKASEEDGNMTPSPPIRVFFAAMLAILLCESGSSVANDAVPAATSAKKAFSLSCQNPFCKSGHLRAGQSCDPRPPEVLRVTSNAAVDDSGDLDIEVELIPSSLASVELIAPRSSRIHRVIQSGAAAAASKLEKGEKTSQRLRFTYQNEDVQEKLVFRVLLRNENGDILADISESIEVNGEPSAEGTPEERVPVVILSGGRRLVQYMTRAEAEERGLASMISQPSGSTSEPGDAGAAIEE